MNAPIPIARRIARNFLAQKAVENSYCNQLAYEALLLMSDQVEGVVDAVESVLDANGITPDSVLSWRDQQFHDLAYASFRHTGQLHLWKDSHLATTEAWMTEGPKRKNGALVHDCSNHPNLTKDDPVGSLLDMQQAYCIRLLRAANFTGNKRYVDECLLQYRTYRDELRSKSGCYHQGKGWLPGDGLSPEPWSRGQGWYLHGLVHCLPLLKNTWPDEQAELQVYTVELLDALVPLQGESGLWHQLVDQPEQSRPDSSGSALILESYVLFQKLSGQTGYESVIHKAWNGLAPLVDENGVVDKACKGPGTIWESDPWRNSEAPKGDAHGIFSMLFACAAIAQ